MTFLTSLLVYFGLKAFLALHIFSKIERRRKRVAWLASNSYFSLYTHIYILHISNTFIVLGACCIIETAVCSSSLELPPSFANMGTGKSLCRNWLASHELRAVKVFPTYPFYSISWCQPDPNSRQFISTANTPLYTSRPHSPLDWCTLAIWSVLRLRASSSPRPTPRFCFEPCASISIWMLGGGGNTYGTWANYPIKRQRFVQSHCRHRHRLVVVDA